MACRIRCYLVLLCIFALIVAFKPAGAQNIRNTLLFNNDWRFHKGDLPDGERVGLDDQQWRKVNLPHDWSIEGPYSEKWASATAYLPAGIGWYRKTFTLPAELNGKQVYIYFDGVYKNSEVWINGHYLGKRSNGFIAFQYELTPYLKKGAENVLAVKVDHSEFADSRWYTGSGIYRDVYLITVSPVHIGLWGIQWTTPQVSEEKADVNIKVAVMNSLPIKKKVRVNCKLTDAHGHLIVNVNQDIHLSKTDSTLANIGLTIKNPVLWSVDHPNLYKLTVTLTVNGVKTDQLQQEVGVREIKFDADKGFFLNGINMKLKGVCIHDDAGALGVAVPPEVWYRRLKLLKEMGCNSLRLSHNPHAAYLYTLCDELGLLVMDEAFDEWEAGKNKWIEGWNHGRASKDGYHEYFADWATRDLAAMVLRDRNHPSVILWSIGNEIDYPNDPYSDSILNIGRNPQIYGKGYLPDHPSARRLGELSKMLASTIKQYDTSRPITAALAGVVMSNTTTFPENLDVVGYNYQEYRYQGDHKLYPNRVIMGSENGMSLGAWLAVDSNAYISGQFLWTGIDYLGESLEWPSHGNGQGLLDLAGLPKPGYYFRQSLWTHKPMIYMETTALPDTLKKGNVRSGQRTNPGWNYQTGEKVRVSCFTNCRQTELFLNGRSLGKKALAAFVNHVIFWDVDYSPGQLIVKANSTAGTYVNYQLETSGQPYAIYVDTDKFVYNRGGLIQLLIKVMDKNGVPVLSAGNEITVKINGTAKLLGLENGDLYSLEDYKSKRRKVFNGNLFAYIQPGLKQKVVSVEVSSPGLKSKALKIKFN